MGDFALDVFTEEHQPIKVATPASSGDLTDVSGAENDGCMLLPGQQERPQASRQATRRIPLFAWPLLLASLASVSSAGVIFASLPEVPTFTLASWRLQTTGFLLIPGAIYQYVNVPAGAAACSALPAGSSRHARSSGRLSLYVQVTDSGSTEVFCSYLLLGPFLQSISLFG